MLNTRVMVQQLEGIISLFIAKKYKKGKNNMGTK